MTITSKHTRSLAEARTAMIHCYLKRHSPLSNRVETGGSAHTMSIFWLSANRNSQTGRGGAMLGLDWVWLVGWGEVSSGVVVVGCVAVGRGRDVHHMCRSWHRSIHSWVEVGGGGGRRVWQVGCGGCGCCSRELAVLLRTGKDMLRRSPLQGGASAS